MTQSLKKIEDTEPWFKQFWPWFLILLPGVVVVAGISTVVIAFRYSDSVVSDNYYREGLAINREVEQDRRAHALGLQAELRIRERLITVQLEGKVVHQSAISLHFSHPLVAEQDFVLPLAQIGAGLYEGQLSAPLDGRWYVELVDLNREWRLQGELLADQGANVHATPERLILKSSDAN